MAENNALVSIIVPVYGIEDYLPSCIESLCRQTYSNIEIILVDDQSQDNCPKICDSYAQQDDRIKVIHQKNTGVSGARNTGMRNMHGDYFMFVDGDDELYPNAVEILMHDINEYGADIVSATKESIDKNGKTVSIYNDERCDVFSGDEPLLLSLAGEKNTNSACAKLFKTSFVEGCCFQEGKNIHEDVFFIFQCYTKHPKLVQHNVPIYKYYLRDGSSSHQFFSDRYLSMLYFCEKKKEIVFEKCPQYTAQAYNMEVRTNLQLLDLLCRTTDKKYKELQKKCVATVRKYLEYHNPINAHHKKLAWIVSKGLYLIYKTAVRVKFYR